MTHAADETFAEGAKAFQAGDSAGAETAFRKALRADPLHWRARYLLGIALHRQGRNGQAVEALAAAHKLQPKNAEIAANLGVVSRAAGRLADAADAFRKAIHLEPKLAAAQRQLAATLFQMRALDEAEAAARRAVELEPEDAEGRTTLGTALESRRDHAGAEVEFRAALLRAPDLPEASNGLGVALRSQGRNREAIELFMRAATLRPSFAEALVNLSAALADEGRFAEAVDAARAALAAAPDLAEAHSNLGNALKDLGRIEEAISAFRRALALDPDLAAAHSNLIFALDYDPATPWAEALAERRRWNDRFAAPLTRAAAAHTNDRDPERRLRVGYVSADFRNHSAALVLAAPLLHHDPAVVEAIGYSSTRAPDDMTARFVARAALWRDVSGIDDAALADLARADRVDILVDLSGHSGGNRLLAFARKPAPIQITAWGYAAGAGLDAMDWIVSDDVVAPPGEACFHERTLRLPAYLSFLTPEDALAPAPAPSVASGRATFGCFNRVVKIGEADFDAFAAILSGAPGSRLVFKDRAFDAAAVQGRFAKAFAARGVATDRLDFIGTTDRQGHLAAHARIDLAFDPIHYGGGVTTMEALWMGVPVLTCLGDRPSARGGASMMRAIGLPEFVASGPANYVAKAIALAAAPGGLAALRGGIRARFARSPFGDGTVYARAVEGAYRKLWRDWCAA